MPVPTFVIVVIVPLKFSKQVSIAFVFETVTFIKVLFLETKDPSSSVGATKVIVGACTVTEIFIVLKAETPKLFKVSFALTL